MKKILLLTALIVMFCCLLTSNTIADNSELEASSSMPLVTASYQSTSIYGMISLPSGQVAPTGGLSIKVILCPIGSGSSYYDYINIAVGSYFTTYSFSIPSSSTTKTYRLSYYLQTSNSTYIDYKDIYYNANVLTTISSNAAPIDISLGNQIFNMTLIKKTTISGTVSLPNGQLSPAGGIDIRVDLSNGLYGYNYITIPEGLNSSTYSVEIDPSSTAQCILKYEIETSGTIYTEYGYYTNIGTTSEYSSAVPIDLSLGTQTGLNLTLLKGTVISGILSLPDGQVAPANGLNIRINFDGIDNGFSQSLNVIIPEGSNSEPYLIAAKPSDKNYTYRLSYFIETSGSTYASGYWYYSNSGLTDKNNATTINTSTGDQVINITVKKNTVISGTISLPNGYVATAGGLSIKVVVDPTSGILGYNKTIIIPEGNNEATYLIEVPPSITSKTYYLYYNLNTTGTVYVMGFLYYSNDGVTQLSKATPFDISLGDQSFDMTLKKHTLISGNIYLPDGQIAPAGGLSVVVKLQHNTYSYTSFVTISIPENSNYGTYTIGISPVEGASTLYRLSYSIQTSETLYYDGYYSTNDTTTEPNSSTPIDISKGDQDFDISIIGKSPYYGDINSDGLISITDVIMVAEIAVGNTNYSPAQIIRANVSNKMNLEIDISDVVMIADRAVGGTTPFPVEI